jgi:hypothetical protein
MDTTPTPAEGVPSARRAGRGVVWLAGVGVLVSGATFVFGGFVALLALPFILPGLRRRRVFAYGLFGGVVLFRALMFAGVNPVLYWAQDRFVTELEAALGAEVSFERAEGDVVDGWMRFEGLRADIPDLRGGLHVGELTVQAGPFMLYRPEGLRVTGTALHLELDADAGRLETWLGGLEPRGTEPVRFGFEQGRLDVAGGTAAIVQLGGVNGESGPEGWVLHVGMQAAEVAFRGRVNHFTFKGGISLGDSGEGLWVEADLAGADIEAGRGILRGKLQPGTQGAIRCTIDHLDLHPLWARYRKVDEYRGTAFGHVDISGELRRLNLDLDLAVRDYSYYHFTAMGLEREHSFRLPEAEISGRLVLVEGRDLEFVNVSVTAPQATLATGRRLSAMGGGMVELKGRFPKLTGRLEAIVESGELNHQITWSREQSESLSDVAPNLLLVGEQFPHLELDWEVEVRALTVNTPPLTGTLTGVLHGTFLKEEGKRLSRLRAAGELSMDDGKVNCLGLSGDLTGRIIFNPTAPTYHAGVRGQITGALGDTPIDCEVTGELSHPGFVFRGLNMGLEALGRKLYDWSAEPLTPAQEVERSNECARVFGAYAAGRRNPFLARSSGKVFFGMR